ncbi:hypothetical protein QTL86_13510 [Cellulosilyticum sp. ST5]|uniref:hypothetical protein n=1 Tax=Cellulosilyticum sp. ST5 TaxID=3055805 RepID=UPI0039779E5A
MDLTVLNQLEKIYPTQDSGAQAISKLIRNQNIIVKGIEDAQLIEGPQGPEGPQGEQGSPGNSPYIGENGNWWIGEVDTGISANAAISVQELQEQINDLLTKTQIPLPYNSGFIDYATSALESYVVKNGLNECKLVINAKPSTGQFSAGQTAIATLPSGYIPSKGYSVGARNSAMTGCSVEILPNGTVNVYTASASDYVFAVIPYDLEV